MTVVKLSCLSHARSDPEEKSSLPSDTPVKVHRQWGHQACMATMPVIRHVCVGQRHLREAKLQATGLKIDKKAGRMSTRTFVPKLLTSVSHYRLWSWGLELFNLKAQEVRENYKQSLLLLLLLLLRRFSRVRLCATPQTAAHQTLPSLGFSRQEYWSGVPLPSLPESREAAKILVK